MDASILLVGSHSFLELFTGFIHQLSVFTVERVSSPREAMSIVQAQQPDMLLLQADHAGCLDVCHEIKAQSHLAWIYCLAVEDSAPTVASSSPIDQMQREIQALEMGADIFLALNFQHFAQAIAQTSEAADQQPAPDVTLGTGEGVLTQNRLQTYLGVGLRQVQNHRELMRTNDILSAIALVDPLTELNNRRAFEWELPRQIQNSQNRQTPISLVMLDVDFFKRINDTYGHRVGDRVLQLISARLRHNLRFYDTPFRYGGEEFVILLSDTGLEEATTIAMRLCELIGDQPFTINESLELTITISAGVASLSSGDDSKGMSLLERADQNLLRAKNQGRNRVVTSDVEPSGFPPLPNTAPPPCRSTDDR